jgi:vitamin B12 transporter
MHKLIHTNIHIVYIFILGFCSQGYLFAFQGVRVHTWPISRMPVDYSSGLSTRFETDTSLISLDRSAPLADLPDGLPDSSGSPTYKLEGVTVTATRVPQTPLMSPLAITVVQRTDIEKMNGTTLADIVSATPGIFVKDYGAVSGIKTVSQRGLGAEHTLVLLDGVRISSAQYGSQDLGLLPVDEIGSVEIVRGGQSASFGADAVAGIINIVSLPIEAKGKVRVLGSAGSFGYRRYHVSASEGNGRDGIRISFGEEKSDGDFPFQFRNGQQVAELRRGNSDLLARYGSMHGRIGFGDRSDLSVRLSAYHSERGVGGVVVSPYSLSIARQWDKDYLLQANSTTRFAGDSQLRVKGQIHSSYERYQDSRLVVGGILLDNSFRNLDFRLEPQYEFSLGDSSRIAVGTELVRTSAIGNSVKNEPTREQAAAYVAGEISVLKGEGVVSQISLFPAMRIDAATAMSPEWSPQLGFILQFKNLATEVPRNPGVILRGSVSRNFRIPTFNELYFAGGGGIGNPSLKPERSTSIDAGGLLHFSLFGDHTMSGTYFLNDMTDRVVWTAAGVGNVTPRNLRKVRSQGIEATYAWQLPDDLVEAALHYTSSYSRKRSGDYPGDPVINTQLIYVPEEAFSAWIGSGIEWEEGLLREAGVRIGYSFTGFRYYTEDNTAFLPGYSVCDLTVRTKLAFGSLGFSVKGEVNNLFDKKYQVIPGYPMPGRSFRMTFGVEY